MEGIFVLIEITPIIISAIAAAAAISAHFTARKALRVASDPFSANWFVVHADDGSKLLNTTNDVAMDVMVELPRGRNVARVSMTEGKVERGDGIVVRSSVDWQRDGQQRLYLTRQATVSWRRPDGTHHTWSGPI